MLGRPKIAPKVEQTIRHQLSAGHGILKVARIVGAPVSGIMSPRLEWDWGDG